MRIVKLSDSVAVSDQISVEDVAQIARDGFQVLVPVGGQPRQGRDSRGREPGATARLRSRYGGPPAPSRDLIRKPGCTRWANSRPVPG
jgi:hypothetical protein